MPLSPPISALLKQFHARKAVRIWSLIVTLYGDAIVPRGGSLWIGSLIEIMALFRIDAGHVSVASQGLHGRLEFGHLLAWLVGPRSAGRGGDHYAGGGRQAERRQECFGSGHESNARSGFLRAGSLPESGIRV